MLLFSEQRDLVLAPGQGVCGLTLAVDAKYLEHGMVGHGDKVPDPGAHGPGEPGGAADEVEAADHPAGPEEGSGNVVPGETLSQGVVGGEEAATGERAEVERRLVEADEHLEGGVDADQHRQGLDLQTLQEQVVVQVVGGHLDVPG